jgi:quinol-cytochrome oxidoreductase complex cytochrome b subunit
VAVSYLLVEETMNDGSQYLVGYEIVWVVLCALAVACISFAMMGYGGEDRGENYY